jgi:cell shape-determining protein MreC
MISLKSRLLRLKRKDHLLDSAKRENQQSKSKKKVREVTKHLEEMMNSLSVVEIAILWLELTLQE